MEVSTTKWSKCQVVTESMAVYRLQIHCTFGATYFMNDLIQFTQMSYVSAIFKSGDLCSLKHILIGILPQFCGHKKTKFLHILQFKDVLLQMWAPNNCSIL